MDEDRSEEDDVSTIHTTSSATDVGPGGHPGDGVCPSVSSLKTVFKSAYDYWAVPTSQIPSEDGDELFDMSMFFQLMTKFPRFRPPQLKDITLPETTPSDLIVELFMSLETCMLSECVNREKKVPYFVVIGCSTWNTYEVVRSDDHQTISQLELPVQFLQSLTQLVLAWSYILCCRWVEILKSSGENAAILRPEKDATNGFWEMIRGEQWQAILSHNGEVYYAPFMLRSSLSSSEIMDHSTTIESHSTVAFNYLTEFCISQNLFHECALALVIVLSLQSPDRPHPKLLEWSSHLDIVAKPCVGIDQLRGLWNVLDQCLMMGCTLDAVDSLLCSAFFDPTLPCNIVGAQWMGIRSALNIEHKYHSQLITAIKKRYPDLAALWLAVICTGQTRQIINLAINPLPPINLVVGAWTGVIQSFLQVQYEAYIQTNQMIARATEFSTAYFVQPEIRLPICRTPPFGKSIVDNTSLLVREHVNHNHRPQQARFFWTLSNGRVAETHERVSVHCPRMSLYQAEEDILHPLSDTEDWSDAMNICSTATSYIFSWHCQNEGGLWLDEGRGSEATRQLQNHPWINTCLFDESENDDEDNSTKSTPSREKIIA